MTLDSSESHLFGVHEGPPNGDDGNSEVISQDKDTVQLTDASAPAASRASDEQDSDQPAMQAPDVTSVVPVVPARPSEEPVSLPMAAVPVAPQQSMPSEAMLPASLAWGQPEVAVKPKKRRRRIVILVASAIVLAGLAAVSVYAFQQHSVADQWKRGDQQAMHRNTQLTAELLATQQNVATLNQQINGLQDQLSSVATQKEQALDKDALLTSALSDAAQVAADLNTCVEDTNVVIQDINDSLSSGFVVESLQSDGDLAQQVCSSAQSENSTLQQDLSGG